MCRDETLSIWKSLLKLLRVTRKWTGSPASGPDSINRIYRLQFSVFLFLKPFFWQLVIR